MTIALSKGSGSAKYTMYDTWLRRANSNVDTVDLSLMTNDEAIDALSHCSGIIFTGGADVDPTHYGMPGEVDRCQIDAERDAREFRLIRKVKDLRLPILGICRGAQILNVAFGGTLYVDVPSDAPSDIEHRCIESVDSEHRVEVEADSLLRKVCRCTEGLVNSSHHQAVRSIAEEFSISARSTDGIIEAFESIEAVGKSYIMAVQWHPERMNFDNPLSGTIAQHFVFECESFQHLFKDREVEQ